MTRYRASAHQYLNVSRDGPDQVSEWRCNVALLVLKNRARWSRPSVVDHLAVKVEITTPQTPQHSVVIGTWQIAAHRCVSMFGRAVFSSLFEKLYTNRIERVNEIASKQLAVSLGQRCRLDPNLSFWACRRNSQHMAI
jgi:hypothetical protein